MPAADTLQLSDGTAVPFVWNEDGWEQLSFEYNSEHWTYPAPAMDIWLDPIAPARTGAAFAEVGLPMPILVQFAGPFQYACFREPQPEQIEAMMAAIGSLMGRFGSAYGFWKQYCEPRIRQATADVEG